MRISDWSSDVCSSDLAAMPARYRDRGPFQAATAFALPWGRDRAPGRGAPGRTPADPARRRPAQPRHPARKSVVSGKRVAVRVDLGGRRLIKKKTTTSSPHVGLLIFQDTITLDS